MSDDKKTFMLKSVDNNNVKYIYIHGPIVAEVDVENFTSLLDELRLAVYEDHFRIYISSCGGNLYDCMQLINAMKQSAASITTVADSYVIDIAVPILLWGDIIEISEYSYININSDILKPRNHKVYQKPSSINYKKINDILYDIFSCCLHKILNENEIKKFFNENIKTEYFFTSEELKTKIKGH